MRIKVVEDELTSTGARSLAAAEALTAIAGQLRRCGPDVGAFAADPVLWQAAHDLVDALVWAAHDASAAGRELGRGLDEGAVLYRSADRVRAR